VIVVGGGILAQTVHARKRTLDPLSVLSLAAGLLYLGGSSITLTQMGIALSRTGPSASAVVTILFILIPLILGVLLIRWGWRERKEIRRKDRVILLALGILGLFLWSGLLAGPVLAVLGAILPRRSIPS
jgi:asparagine N-glycosylation enzyme membrane subunit Stt3